MSYLSAAPAQIPHLWDEIVHSTIEACILRKEGREREVAGLIQEKLPTLIRRWSSTCGLSPETCKRNLRALFQRVQEGVEMGFIHRRLIVDEICARLSGGSPKAVPAAVAAESGPIRLRRRVAIDDVSGMLDAMAEAELETRREAILPMRPAASALIHLFTGAENSPAVLTA
ncbi:MAG TPA: hypothetical protein VGL42_11725 [Opitutaceae bacterium]|jgi:hypothetical protein